MASARGPERETTPENLKGISFSFRNVRVRQIRTHEFEHRGLIWKDIAPEEVHSFDRLSGQLGNEFLAVNSTFRNDLTIPRDRRLREIDEMMNQASGRPFVSVTETEPLFPVHVILNDLAQGAKYSILDLYDGLLSPKVHLGLKGNVSALRQVPEGLFWHNICLSTEAEGPALACVVVESKELFETCMTNEIYKQDMELWNSLDAEEKTKTFPNGKPKKCVKKCTSGIYRPTLKALINWGVMFNLIRPGRFGTVTVRSLGYYWIFDVQDSVSFAINLPNRHPATVPCLGATWEPCACLTSEQLEEFREDIAGHDTLAEYRNLHGYDFSSIVSPASIAQLQEDVKYINLSYKMVIPSKTIAIEFNFNIEGGNRKVQDALKATVDGVSHVHMQGNYLWAEFANRKMAEAAFEHSANWSEKIFGVQGLTGEDTKRCVESVRWNLPNRIKKAFGSDPSNDFNQATGEFRVDGLLGAYKIPQLEKKLVEQIENCSYYFEKLLLHGD